MPIQPVTPHPLPPRSGRLAFSVLLVCLLTACASGATPSQAIEPPAEPAVQSPTGSVAPLILRVENRQQVSNGYRRIIQDIYFQDPDGDAVAVTSQLVSTTLVYPPEFSDEAILAPAAEQKVEALFSMSIPCFQKMELTFENRIRDQAGHLSDPVLFSMSCTAPEAVDTRALLISSLSLAIPLALLLLLGFWLLFRKRPAERLPALRATLLFTFLFMILRFIHLVFHEGGHALYPLANGTPVTLYVHPFFFRGFSRPLIFGYSIWKDILGSAVALPLALLIFSLFWKRRSTALLPLVMLVPFIALSDGFNVMGLQDDFHNLIQATGLPAAPFLILGLLIFCFGLISMLSLFPLAGLDPRDSQALFVLPAALFLGCALSLPVAHLVVPGSPIHQEYFMAWEILADNYFIFWVSFGVAFALLYVSLFRKLYPRLPAWLHNPPVALTWSDLRLPGLLWAASLIIGLIIIR